MNANIPSPAARLSRLERLTSLLTFALAATAFCLGVGVSCMSESQKKQALGWGSLALTAAELSGGVNPSQAALARRAGVLLFTADPAKDPDGALKLVSEEILQQAVASGKITPAQAEIMRAQGTVPLLPSPVSTPPVTVLPTTPPTPPGGSADTPVRF